MDDDKFISKYERLIDDCVKSSNVTIIIASALSGVYTELPKYLSKDIERNGWIGVVVNNPERRAIELVESLGNTQRKGILQREMVGFSIPFKAFVSNETKVKYLNADMLLREALIDPLLRSYKMIYVEDVHERLAWTDVLLGVLKKVQNVREELKIFLHTITEDIVDILQPFFSRSENNRSGQSPAAGGKVIQIQNDQASINHVDVLYASESKSDYVQGAVDVLVELYNGVNSRLAEVSTVVVILSTKGDISRAQRLLRGESIPKDISIVDGIPDIKELRRGGLIVFSCEDKIENDLRLLNCGTIRFVIDCGYRSLSWYTGGNDNVNNIVNYPISKSQAELRKQLASYSDGSGKCFRLYTEQAAFDILSDGYLPEIHATSELPEILLRLKALGIDNIARSFPFLTSPSVESFSFALSTLYWLEVIDDGGKMTKLGEKIALLPVNLQLSRALYYASTEFNCPSEIISIVSMIEVGGLQKVLMKSEESVAYNKRFYSIEGDYLTLLNIYTNYISIRKDGLSFTKKWSKSNGINGDILEQAIQINKQLNKAVIRIGLSTNPSSTSTNLTQLTSNISNCITKAFFLQVAKRISENTYQLVNSTTTTNSTMSTSAKPDTFSVYRDFTKPLHSPWVVYEKLIKGSDGIIYMIGINMADRSVLESTKYYKSIRS